MERVRDMLSKKMEKALNEQINAEYYSSYLYLSMAAWCYAENLSGFGHWMELQAQEELGHVYKLFKYVNDRGGRVILKAIKAPPTNWSSPLAVMEETLKHEKKVTAMINKLAELALAEKDFATNALLQWYINEQVEEEASASDIVNKLKMVKGAGNGLLMMDRALSQRQAQSASTQEAT